jgi:hypothetical protein
METKRVRLYFPAIAAAAVACFVFEAVWYGSLLDVWLKGNGHDRAWLESTKGIVGLQWAAALLAEAVIAACISWVTQGTGTQTAGRGMWVGALLWLGLVFTTSAVRVVFVLGSYQAFAIDAGFWLIGMAIMGAIVGGWKKRAAAL